MTRFWRQYATASASGAAMLAASAGLGANAGELKAVSPDQMVHWIGGMAVVVVVGSAVVTWARMIVHPRPDTP